MNPTQFRTWLADPQRPPLVMGVLNVTPDSFSDGGRFAAPAAAIAHGLELAAAGADLIDIGGESTRPGAGRTAADEQLRRIRPVVETLIRELGDRCILSIDTTQSAVAQAGLDAGAALINDISGATEDPQMLRLAAARQAPIVLMHMQGQPATMQVNPTYGDVAGEVREYLAARARAALEAGVAADRILVDPGIGFGKTVEHNLQLLRRLRELAGMGYPLLVGVSRKGFIGRISGETDPAPRLMGTAAAVAWCVANGAAIVRVHDVEPMSRVVRVIRAIQSGQAGP